MNSDVLGFKPPSNGILRTFLHLQSAYFSPVFVGLEALALEKPALWVGNHTLYGLMDAPLLALHLLESNGIALRSLGDRGHFKVPLWRTLLTRSGVVEGSRENCSALMSDGQHVLVFPGGGREVMRRKGEAYKLIWKQRTGFARMAIKHGYDIIPFASLGPDDSLDIVWDANDLMSLPLWQWLDGQFQLGELTRHGDAIPPITRGVGLSCIPRPERFYFGFGERITTTNHRRHEDDETLWNLRNQVADSIQHQLAKLKVFRENDKTAHWPRWRRWLT